MGAERDDFEKYMEKVALQKLLTLLVKVFVLLKLQDQL